MIVQYCRNLFVFAAILISFATNAADEKNRVYFPGKFELARRAQSLIDTDAPLMDEVLKNIFKILDLKIQGSEHIRDAALHLQDLIVIHSTQKLGTKERERQLTNLKNQAQEFYALYKKEPKVEEPADLTDMSSMKIDAGVMTFIKDYLDGLREFERITVQGAAAITMVGASLGCGVGMLTYLSGRRCLALCPTLGWASSPLVSEAVPFGVDASIECSRGVSSSCLSSSWRLHCAAALGCVKDLEGVNTKSPDFGRYAFKNKHFCEGLAAGGCIMEVISGTIDIPIIPLPSSYGFAKERLGITYENL